MTKYIVSAIVGALVVVGLSFLIAGNSQSLGSIRTIQDDFTAGLTIGDGGSVISMVDCTTGTWNPGSLTSSTAPVTAATSTNITLTGATVSDQCSVRSTFQTSTLSHLTCHISAADTATVVLENLAGAALDHVTGTVQVCYGRAN